MSERGSLPSPVGEWLSSKELAALAGIHQRKASEACKCCHEGGKWRGHALAVRRKDGKAYEVNAVSLPPDLFAKWLADQPKPLAPVAVQNPVQLPATLENRGVKLAAPESIEEAKWKRALIEPALSYQARSRERGSAIKDIAAREHTKPCGKVVRISPRTLSEWLKRFESDAFGGLVRKRRHEEARVLITQKWDAACPLPDERKGDIKAAIETYIKSLWGNGSHGWPDVARFGQTQLMQLSHEAGWQGGRTQLWKTANSHATLSKSSKNGGLGAWRKKTPSNFSTSTVRASFGAIHYCRCKRSWATFTP